MITHEAPPMKKKENPGRAAAYLLYGKDYDPDNEISRVKYSGTLNAQNEDVLEAAAELTSLADFGRKGGRHTVHYIISLHPGEHLTQEQWLNVLKTHLRETDAENLTGIWTVHKDTDNEHLHVLLCTLDPATHKVNSLSFSHRNLQKADAICERRFKLTADPHPLYKGEETRTKAEMQSADYEAKTGRQSLLSYVSELKGQIRKCQSWEELHALLKKNGLRLEKTGRGLIVVSPDPENPEKNIAVKGSSVSRKADESLSLSTLEKRFGSWIPPKENPAVQERSYDGRPVGFQNDSAEEQFRRFKNDGKLRKDRAAELRSKQDEENRSWRAQRKRTAEDYRQKLNSANPAEKSEIQRAYVKRLEDLDREYEKICLKIGAAWKELLSDRNFMEYLRLKPDQLKGKARRLLFKRKGAMSQREKNCCAFQNSRRLVKGRLILKHTYFAKRTRKGQDIYINPANGDRIRDDGATLLCNDSPMITTVSDLLLIAKTHDPNGVPKISGSEDFQVMCASSAASLNMDITCDDAWAQAFFERRKYDRTNQYRSGIQSRDAGSARYRRSGLGNREQRDIRRGIRSVGQLAFVRRRSFVFVFRSRISGGGSAAQSDPAFSEAQTRSASAAGRRDLPPLSQRDLDVHAQERDVLLSADERDLVGEHGSGEVLHRVRRKVPEHRAGREIKASPAIAKYLEERNLKADAGVPGVLPHRLWEGEDGEMIFSGIRHPDGEDVILLSDGKQIFVKPSDEKAINHIKNVKVGEKVIIDRAGRITVPHRAQRRYQHHG